MSDDQKSYTAFAGSQRVASGDLASVAKATKAALESGEDAPIVILDDEMFRRGRITFPVTYCTSYSDRRQPSVREMEEIAWILRSDPKRKEIGFVHGSKLRDRERLVDIDE